MNFIDYLNEPDETIVEIANLSGKRTGIDGWVIYISTKEGKHGPRIKLAKTPKMLDSKRHSTIITFSESGVNLLFDNSGASPSIVKRAMKFAELNKTVLLDFWYNGTEWMDEVVEEMKHNFIKV